MQQKGQHLLQDPFLNNLRKERVPVSIYLVNGIKLQGQIESFDQYVVLLRNTVTQMVYKHAISTIVPARPLGHGGQHLHQGGYQGQHNTYQGYQSQPSYQNNYSQSSGGGNAYIDNTPQGE